MDFTCKKKPAPRGFEGMYCGCTEGYCWNDETNDHEKQWSKHTNSTKKESKQ